METSSLDFSKGEEMNFLVKENQAISSNQILGEVDLEISNNRIQICFNCEFLDENRICLQCGCPIIMMAKIGFNDCPKGKW